MDVNYLIAYHIVSGWIEDGVQPLFLVLSIYRDPGWVVLAIVPLVGAQPPLPRPNLVDREMLRHVL
jgi:hypothetical protein